MQVLAPWLGVGGGLFLLGAALGAAALALRGALSRPQDGDTLSAAAEARCIALRRGARMAGEDGLSSHISSV